MDLFEGFRTLAGEFFDTDASQGSKVGKFFATLVGTEAGSGGEEVELASAGGLEDAAETMVAESGVEEPSYAVGASDAAFDAYIDGLERDVDEAIRAAQNLRNALSEIPPSVNVSYDQGFRQGPSVAFLIDAIDDRIADLEEVREKITEVQKHGAGDWGRADTARLLFMDVREPQSYRSYSLGEIGRYALDIARQRGSVA